MAASILMLVFGAFAPTVAADAGTFSGGRAAGFALGMVALAIGALALGVSLPVQELR